MASSALIKKSMRLFGMPYQFNSSVDPRIDGISSTIGRKFMDNIMLEAPVVTIIPGKPKYLPADNDTDKRISSTQALLQSASDGFSTLHDYINQSSSNSDKLRLYDFERNYTRYMNYVNILCRTGATFLELTDTMDGTPFQSYDWRNYRQTSSNYFSAVGNSLHSIASSVKNAFLGKSTNTKSKSSKKFDYETADGSEEEIASMEETLTSFNFVQFFVDPDVRCDESMANSTSESSLKSMMDTGSNYLKDLSFMLDSGGVDSSGISDLTSSTADALQSVTSSIAGSGTISGALSRVINLSGEVLKGNNIVMPDIYQNSTYSKSYSMTVHLKTPYGTKLGYYLDIFVPMMHLLALAIPKQATANTYAAPFLIKAYVDGLFTCNLGIVTDIAIAKVSETRSIDGLPTEVDVTLNITDLYSDLMLSPSSDPFLFVNNSSLVEYLAVNCGLSLINPKLQTKLEYTINAIRGSITDIPDNVTTTIKEKISGVLAEFSGLTW